MKKNFGDEWSKTERSGWLLVLVFVGFCLTGIFIETYRIAMPLIDAMNHGVESDSK